MRVQMASVVMISQLVTARCTSKAVLLLNAWTEATSSFIFLDTLNWLTVNDTVTAD